MVITRCLHTYDINATNMNGYTPLMAAATYGKEELMRLICNRTDNQADKRSKSVCGSPALHRAIERGFMKCMKILLDVGNADVNVICRQQSISALHAAAQYGRIQEAALLVEKGALLEFTATT